MASRIWRLDFTKGRYTNRNSVITLPLKKANWLYVFQAEISFFPIGLGRPYSRLALYKLINVAEGYKSYLKGIVSVRLIVSSNKSTDFCCKWKMSKGTINVRNFDPPLIKYNWSSEKRGNRANCRLWGDGLSPDPRLFAVKTQPFQ